MTVECGDVLVVEKLGALRLALGRGGELKERCILRFDVKGAPSPCHACWAILEDDVVTPAVERLSKVARGPVFETLRPSPIVTRDLVSVQVWRALIGALIRVRLQECWRHCANTFDKSAAFDGACRLHEEDALWPEEQLARLRREEGASTHKGEAARVIVDQLSAR